MDMPVNAPTPNAGPGAPTGRPASDLLNDLVEAFPGETVSVGDLVDRLDSRAHGMLLLVLALPMCVPNVPGISTIFGALMLAPAIQLVLGSRRLWLPRRLRDTRVQCSSLRQTFNVAIPGLKRVEYLIRPRWSRLTRFPVTIMVGLQTLLMAVILILPIPFANWPPGITVAMTSLALLQRDGLLMLLTIPAAIASVASVYLGARVGFAAIDGFIHWIQNLIS
jgi:hypothetical protein